MLAILIVFALIAIICGVPLLHLRGKSLSAYDTPLEASMSSDSPSAVNAEVHAWAAGMGASMARGTPRPAARR
jgi:hypothetical protein